VYSCANQSQHLERGTFDNLACTNVQGTEVNAESCLLSQPIVSTQSCGVRKTVRAFAIASRLAATASFIAFFELIEEKLKNSSLLQSLNISYQISLGEPQNIFWWNSRTAKVPPKIKPDFHLLMSPMS